MVNRPQTSRSSIICQRRSKKEMWAYLHMLRLVMITPLEKQQQVVSRFQKQIASRYHQTGLRSTLKYVREHICGKPGLHVIIQRKASRKKTKKAKKKSEMSEDTMQLREVAL